MSFDDVEVQAEKETKPLYNKFANYFCDDKENLKDIFMQLGTLDDNEVRIKEELFMLLYFFIITFSTRKEVI